MFAKASELLLSVFCQALGTERASVSSPQEKKDPWVSQAQAGGGKGVLQGLRPSSQPVLSG